MFNVKEDPTYMSFLYALYALYGSIKLYVLLCVLYAFMVQKITLCPPYMSYMPYMVQK